MKHPPFAVIAVLFAVLSLMGLLWFGTSYSGVVHYQGSRHSTFSETLCGPGKIPVVVHEPRFGTGKAVITDCVFANEIIEGQNTPFPPIRQRYRDPRWRKSY